MLNFRTTFNVLSVFISKPPCMKRFVLLCLLTLLFEQGYSQITGTVFRDYNMDGTFQPGIPNNEYGVGGIKVKIYDANNIAIDSTISTANGTYSLPFTVPVRVEFEFMLPTPCVDSNVDFNSFALGGDNVRFVTTSTNNLDYGIQNPQDYQITADPYIYIAKLNRGDPLQPGASATADALYGYLYSSAAFTPTFTAPASAVGTLWGIAYSRQAKKVFAAAFMKRQCGYGPMGSGGIYLCTPTGTSFTVTNFYDMDANGHRTRALPTAVPYGNGTSFTINAAGTEASYLGPIDPLTGDPEGLGVIGVNGAGGRGFTSSLTDHWNDPAALDQVGKVGLGDIDISEDGKFLYVANLYSRMLFRLELDNPASPTSVIAVDSFPLPNVTANNGKLRCFGVSYYRGAVYVGAVTTGENGGQNIVNGATDLYAYVFKLENALSAIPTYNATPAITFPLNYLKGAVIGGSGTQWYPWNKKTDILLPGEPHLPTPMLSDIEFSDGGDLIMDFCDRTGHQFMISNRLNLTGTELAGSIDIGGDILIAGTDCNTGVFTLENNGSYTSNGTVFNGGVGNGEGVGGGEFFLNDEWASFHHETSVGSCGVLRGRREVVVSLMDPVNAFSNGTAKFSTINGGNSNNMQLASTVEMGKANSLGDIEVAGDAAPLQIGNRIWTDDNANGIQDPTELGIADVTVELFADFDNNGIPDGGSLGNTQSNSGGYYYFDPSNVLDGDPVVPGLQPGPVPRKYYLIRIGAADWAAGAGINDLNGMSLGIADVGSPVIQADVRDNDAIILGNIPTIDSVLARKNARNDHTYDFAFIPCPLITPQDVTITCKDTVLPIGPVSQPGNTYSWSPGTGLSETNVAQPMASPTVTTTYTLTVNNLCSFVYTAFVDNDPPDGEAGPPKMLSCDMPSVVIGNPAIGTNTYSWSPGNSLNDSTIAQPIASPSTTTQYTLTVTGANGCPFYDYVTISREPCCARIVVPNAFTPNDDNKNDGFGVIVIENVEKFYLTVYNRWGERVFETEDPKVKWDGMYKNKRADVGTYFYYIKYNCQTFKEPRFIKGDVELMQ